MSDVIVPCYVSALHRLKDILCFDLENATSEVLPLDVFHDKLTWEYILFIGVYPLVKTAYKKLENIFNFSHIWKKSMKDIQWQYFTCKFSKV
jgi:hypothetical protein